MGTTAEKLAYLANTKADIRAAMVEKGIEVPENTTFREYAEKIAAIPSKMAQTYIPGKENQIIDAGQYLKESQTIQGDANLLPENIVSGKSIFGVAGSASGKKVLIFENLKASTWYFDGQSATFPIGSGYDGYDIYIANLRMYGTLNCEEFSQARVTYNSPNVVVGFNWYYSSGLRLEGVSATIVLVEK